MRRLPKPFATTYETTLFSDMPKRDQIPKILPEVEIAHVGQIRVGEERMSDGTFDTVIRVGNLKADPSDKPLGLFAGYIAECPDQNMLETLNSIYDLGVESGRRRERSRIVGLSRELSAEDPLMKLRSMIVADDDD